MSNVFTFNFDQFNDSLMNKSINVFQTKFYCKCICLFIASE